MSGEFKISSKDNYLLMKEWLINVLSVMESSAHGRANIKE